MLKYNNNNKYVQEKGFPISHQTSLRGVIPSNKQLSTKQLKAALTTINREYLQSLGLRLK